MGTLTKVDAMKSLRIALREAVMEAINEVGIENFKKTSMFMSNDSGASLVTEKRAA